MALAHLNNGRIELESLWREKELCKQAGLRWDSDARLWWAPLSWSACVTLRGVFKDRLEISPLLNEWAAQEIEARVRPCMELRQASVLSDDDPVRQALVRCGYA